jgi:hypothetical protein
MLYKKCDTQIWVPFAQYNFIKLTIANNNLQCALGVANLHIQLIEGGMII